MRFARPPQSQHLSPVFISLAPPCPVRQGARVLVTTRYKYLFFLDHEVCFEFLHAARSFHMSPLRSTMSRRFVSLGDFVFSHVFYLKYSVLVSHSLSDCRSLIFFSERISLSFCLSVYLSISFIVAGTLSYHCLSFCLSTCLSLSHFHCCF